MTVLTVLTVLAALENALPTFRWSFKMQDKQVTMTVFGCFGSLGCYDCWF